MKMRPELTIREFVLDDYDTLSELLKLNIPIYFAEDELSDFQNYLKEEVEDYFVAELAGKIVGSGGLNYIVADDIVFISWDLIHPDFHRMGIGKALLNHRIQLARNRYPSARIVVRTSQLVFRFYEKQGFKLLEKHKDYWAVGYDMYKMLFSPADVEGN
jgi:ribosomal-protein-alanine N-acetyltransferase